MLELCDNCNVPLEDIGPNKAVRFSSLIRNRNVSVIDALSRLFPESDRYISQEDRKVEKQRAFCLPCARALGNIYHFFNEFKNCSKPDSYCMQKYLRNSVQIISTQDTQAGSENGDEDENTSGNYEYSPSEDIVSTEVPIRTRRPRGYKKLLKNTDVEANKPFACPKCDQKFGHQGPLTNHLRGHDGPSEFTCSICPKTFTVKGSYIIHMKLHEGKKPFICHLCSKSFSQKGNLNTHLRTHQGTKLFNCTLCPKSYRQQGHLKDHLKIHEGKRDHSCPQCPKSFVRKQHLTSHLISHDGTKAFQCEECSKSFSRKDKLAVHMRIHNPTMLHNCSQCSKSFTSNHALRLHVLVHDGMKPFSCSQCTKSYLNNCALEAHLRTHDGIRPFSCTQCDKSFSLKHILTRHLKLHAKKSIDSSQCPETISKQEKKKGTKHLGCSHCPKFFKNRGALDDHERIHNGVKPFTCHQCKKPFRVKWHVGRHLKLVHGKEKTRSPSNNQNQVETKS